MCLVNPNHRTPAPFSAIEPPLWLGLIAGYRLSERVAIIDAEAEGLTVTETIQRVQSLKPREILIVVMGTNPSVSSTPKMPVAEELLKHLDAKLTGLHPIAMKHPKAIPTPFGGFPFVPWELLPMHRYRAHNWHCLEDLDKRNSYAVLYTSLNCPYSCSYCNIHTLYGDRQIRYRPIEDIKGELRIFANRGIRNIKIWDELFCLKEERVLEICDYIISEKFDFNIWAYARVDTVNKKMLFKMKEAGVNWLCYGLESSEGIRKQANKKTSDKVTTLAIDATRNIGINILANFMFGLPGDTLDSMKATLDMAIEENFEYVNFYVALPYPGSDWYEKLDKKPTDWSNFNQFSPNICASPEVVRFRDEAFKTYFNRPEYLSMIKRKFGDKAEAHINEMLHWQIRKSL